MLWVSGQVKVHQVQDNPELKMLETGRTPTGCITYSCLVLIFSTCSGMCRCAHVGAGGGCLFFKVILFV